MIWIILGSFGLISCILGIIYTPKITPTFQSWGLFSLGLSKSDQERNTVVRFVMFVGSMISLIILTRNFQLIVGLIGMILGAIIMRYSVPIHRFLAAGGGARGFFRGDNGIKLFGICVFLGSALWMSGLTQNVLIWFFGSSGLIPSP